MRERQPIVEKVARIGGAVALAIVGLNFLVSATVKGAVIGGAAFLGAWLLLKDNKQGAGV